MHKHLYLIFCRTSRPADKLVHIAIFLALSNACTVHFNNDLTSLDNIKTYPVPEAGFGGQGHLNTAANAGKGTPDQGVVFVFHRFCLKMTAIHSELSELQHELPGCCHLSVLKALNKHTGGNNAVIDQLIQKWVRVINL